MRRGSLTVALVALLVPAAPAAAAEPARVKLVECSLEDREAAFHARMRIVAGAERMAMRFTLLERTGADEFRAVKAPELARWHSAKPGVRAFGYRQGVRNLPAGTSHRMRVDFRWYSSDGAVVERARRRSPECRQFTGLPNLVARITGATPTELPGVVRYGLLVRNDGRAPAAAVPVQLRVDGDVVDTVTVASLSAGEERSLVIRGPACRRSLLVEADPDEAIAESSEDDNSHGLTCAALTNMR
jgi:hypothetical protein